MKMLDVRVVKCVSGNFALAIIITYRYVKWKVKVVLVLRKISFIFLSHPCFYICLVGLQARFKNNFDLYMPLCNSNGYLAGHTKMMI